MTDKSLTIKITIFQSEVEMLPIYERLIDRKEREAANILIALLLNVLETNKIPAWFNTIDRTRFPSFRGRSIRLRLNKSAPQYSHLLNLLLPLSENDRILSIKQLLRGALLSPDQGKLIEIELPSKSPDQARPAIQEPYESESPTLDAPGPVSTMKPIDPHRMNQFKKLANHYSKPPETPSHP